MKSPSSKSCLAITLLALGTSTALADAGAIGPGFTGAWFDPAQSGHGLFVEILPDNRIQAAWFTFNPAGTEQAWFVGTGTYAGNTATLTSVVQPAGGRWIPNFDPTRVISNGAGSMNLTRLTQPAGLACP